METMDTCNTKREGVMTTSVALAHLCAVRHVLEPLSDTYLAHFLRCSRCIPSMLACQYLRPIPRKMLVRFRPLLITCSLSRHCWLDMQLVQVQSLQDMLTLIVRDSSISLLRRREESKTVLMDQLTLTRNRRGRGQWTEMS